LACKRLREGCGRPEEDDMGRGTRIGAFALTAALFVAGCGDDDDGALDGVTTTTADGATTTTALGDATTTTGPAADTAGRLAQELEDAGLGSLASLVRTVDVEELLPEGDFTLFAPNDAAVRSLDTDDLRDLLADPGEVLTILENHVVEERITASELEDRATVTTRAGRTLTIASSAGEVTVGGATVVDADIEAAGGVVHVIDGVLLPDGAGS
jgi:uncharacterized surface protein with fasciclin (FAS1) repeats